MPGGAGDNVSAAVQHLRDRGWCLLSPSPEQRDAIEAANRCAAEFFAQPLAAKRSLRRAADTAAAQPETGSTVCPPPRQPDPTRARQVATAGVGFLSSPAREWFHLAADPAALSQMRWPSEAFQRATLRLLRVLESVCTMVLAALGDQSELAAQHVAVAAAGRERWGDPSVLDLFHYRDGGGSGDSDGHAAAPVVDGAPPPSRPSSPACQQQQQQQQRRQQQQAMAMGSHTDPGLLTITPCSAIPALELLDTATGEWVGAEHPDVCGGTHGPGQGEREREGLGGDHRLLLFAGDALEDCGCGCVAVSHRVRRTAGKRLSLVYEMRRWEEQEDSEEEEPEEQEEQDTSSSSSALEDSTTWACSGRPGAQARHRQPHRDDGREAAESGAKRKRRDKSCGGMQLARLSQAQCSSSSTHQ
jgi:hypothetical protein